MKPNLTVFTKDLRVNQTPWESKLWYHLRGKRFLGLKFKRQVPIGEYIVDLCCQEKRLIVELDGGHHSEKVTSLEDKLKQQYLESKGYKVLRFWNNEIDENIDGVLETIRRNVNNFDLSPNLSPSPGEREL